MATNIEFRAIAKREADSLFTAPRSETKWGPVTASLLAGDSVFVPGMTRTQLETLRSIVSTRRYGTLISKTTVMDEVRGRLLRITR